MWATHHLTPSDRPGGRTRLRAAPVLTLLAAAAACVTALGVTAPPAWGVAPGNDTVAGAIAIEIPSTTSLSVDEATTDPDELTPCAWGGPTLWYVLAPSRDMNVRLSLPSPWGAPNGLALYVGAPGTLTEAGCVSSNGVLPLTGGTTYYLQVATSGQPVYYPLTVTEAVPPANDDLADAASIPGLGELVSTSTVDATTEPGEETCAWGDAATVWYRFTAPSSAAYLVSWPDDWSQTWGTGSGVYTGDGYPLTLLRCGLGGFTATAGQTYWIQVHNEGSAGMTRFSLDLAGPPAPVGWVDATTPNAGDDVRFEAWNYYDPAGTDVTLRWDFGDGAAADGASASHAYTADGDYLAVFTSTTADGRVGRWETTIQVRTRDVVVVSVTAPTTARAGQVKTFTTALRNTHYLQPVVLRLLLGTRTGWTEVGSTNATLPVKTANKTTSIALSYAFTKADAAAGSVSFKVVCDLTEGRDAVLVNNEMVTPPVRVSK
jgi:hypothetical protein